MRILQHIFRHLVIYFVVFCVLMAGGLYLKRWLHNNWVSSDPMTNMKAELVKTTSYESYEHEEYRVVRFDEHLWVLYVNHFVGGVSIAHHPDCPCFKGANR